MKSGLKWHWKMGILRKPSYYSNIRLLLKKNLLNYINQVITTVSFNKIELETIAGFLGQPLEAIVKKGKISLQDFEAMLQRSKFSSYTLVQLLEEVLQEKLITNKEVEALEKMAEEQYFQRLSEQFPQSKWWFEWIQVNPHDAKFIWSLFRKEKEGLFNLLAFVHNGLMNLPLNGEYERLPLFSQKITGNPHSFDLNGSLGKLLLHSLYVYKKLHNDSEIQFPKTTEEINDLLSEFNIVRDDLWNFVTCQGLLASCDDIVHPVWEAAIKTNYVMNVPMRELIKLKRVWPATGNKIWVVENSSVSSSLMDAQPHSPIVCTHGQIRTAGWMLLDRLVESGCTLYYSGDFDPEGLVIAEKMKKRYKGNVILWRMDEESYIKSLSEEDITDRTAKLNNIHIEELQNIKKTLLKIGKSGYQEAIIQQLIEDMVIGEI